VVSAEQAFRFWFRLSRVVAGRNIGRDPNSTFASFFVFFERKRECSSYSGIGFFGGKIFSYKFGRWTDRGALPVVVVGVLERQIRVSVHGAFREATAAKKNMVRKTFEPPDLRFSRLVAPRKLFRMGKKLDRICFL